MDYRHPQPQPVGFSIRGRIVQAVHSPLGFCVLALMIVEMFLLGAGIWFDLPLVWRLTAIGIAVLLFIGVFITVIWLVVKHTEKLVFSEHSHIELAAMRIYGTESRQLSSADIRSMQKQISTTAESARSLPPAKEDA